MKIIVFLGLAILEYIMIAILTSRLSKLKEYISMNYFSFQFSNIGEKPYGLNILIKILFPTAFMVICSGILYNFKFDCLVSHMYCVVILYYLIRWFIIIFISNTKELINWKQEVSVFFIAVLINIGVYYFFVKETTEIFISIDKIRDAVWIAIISFVFVIIRNFVYKYTYVDNCKLEKRKEKYILKKYEYLVNKYQDIVQNKNKQLNIIAYAVMIYENFNRPKLIRILEIIKFAVRGRASLGIMQVNTRVLINDRNSVIKGYNILKSNYFNNRKKFQDNEQVIEETISSYNGGSKYLNEIKYIMEIIEKQDMEA